MSKKAHLFSPGNAPRGGGKKGRKVKLSAQAMAILDKFLMDFARNGQRAITTLRVENPAAYVRLGLETSTKVALGAPEIDDGRPMHLIVSWGTRGDSSRPMPTPPEQLKPVNPSPPPPPMPEPESPQNTPQYSPPRLLTFARPDAPA